MSSITAEQVTGMMNRVTVELDASISGSMSIWRVEPSGARRRVIGASGAAQSGSWDDPEAPIGKPVTYVAEIIGAGTAGGMGPELIVNGGGEDGVLAPWTVESGTSWRVTSASASGVHSGGYRFLCAGDQDGLGVGVLAQMVAVQGGGLFEVSLWCAPAYSTLSVVVAPDVGDPTTIPVAGTSAWTQTVSRVQVPDGASTVTVRLVATDGSADTWDRVDDVSLRQVVPAAGDNPTIGPSNPVTIDSDKPLISDPYRSLVCPVIVLQEGQDRTMAGRDTAVDIVGRRSRVHVWDVEGAPTFSPQFITEPADHEAFEELMETGDPFLIRHPCTVHPDMWVQRGGDRTWSWLTRRCLARKHTLSSCEELDGPPSDDPVWGDTLGDLHAAVGGDGVGTLGAIAARWGTLGEIAADDLKALT